MKKLAFLIVLLFATAAPAFSQTNCSPFMGLSTAQFWDNQGNLLLNGALYSYVAGSTSQAPTFSDSQCSQVNVNPLTFGSGARATIWVNTSSFYKFVLCAVATDGPFCNAADVLFSVDGIQGGASGGGGGASCASGCTGFFISGTASPATSGVLRMASGDSFGFRNAAGSGNLLFSKTANDVLTWQGGSILFPEIGAPSGVSGDDLLYADNTAHRWRMINNNGTAAQVVGSGNDISTSDSVTQVHFGASAAPISNTLPNTGQCVIWNGTNLAGGCTIYNTTISEAAASIPSQTLVTVGGSDTNYFLTFHIAQTVATSGCTGNPTLVINVTYTEAFTGASRVPQLQIINENSGVQTNSISFLSVLSTNTDGYGYMALRAKASTTISYSGTYGVGTGCSTGATYSVAPVLFQQ